MDMSRDNVYNIVKNIVFSFCNLSLSKLDEYRNENLFSMKLGLSYIDVVYIFIQIEDVFGIQIGEIDFKNETLFTIDGIVDLIYK